jgi:hydrogenase nickel incorporation protein HypA/HybF
MHELSLVNAMLDIVAEYAGRRGFRKVNSLKLSCGRLSCIEPEALHFAFSIQSQGTTAAGASLELEVLPVVISCLACAQDFDVDAYPAACPRCGGVEVALKGGREELRLLELDVDEE